MARKKETKPRAPGGGRPRSVDRLLENDPGNRLPPEKQPELVNDMLVNYAEKIASFSEKNQRWWYEEAGGIFNDFYVAARSLSSMLSVATSASTVWVEARRDVLRKENNVRKELKALRAGQVKEGRKGQTRARFKPDEPRKS